MHLQTMLHRQPIKPVIQMQSGMSNVTQESKSAGNQTGETAQSLMNQTGEALQQINPFK